jgi:hypothetical protein
LSTGSISVSSLPYSWRTRYRRTTSKDATKTKAFGTDPNMPAEEAKFDVVSVLASDLPLLS